MDLNLEYDYTLNGDGSGKVALRWTTPIQDRSPKSRIS